MKKKQVAILLTTALLCLVAGCGKKEKAVNGETVGESVGITESDGTGDFARQDWDHQVVANNSNCIVAIMPAQTVGLVLPPNISDERSERYKKWFAECEQWKNVVEIAMTNNSIYGLLSDGTVVTTDVILKKVPQKLENIVKLFTADRHIVAIDSQGKAHPVVPGKPSFSFAKSDGIVSIDSPNSDLYYVAVYEDGTIDMLPGESDEGEYEEARKNAAGLLSLTDVKAVVADKRLEYSDYYYALKQDGTVVQAHKEEVTEIECFSEGGFIRIVSNYRILAALREDGTISFYDLPEGKQTGIFTELYDPMLQWENVKQLEVWDNTVIGVTDDGSLLSAGFFMSADGFITKAQSDEGEAGVVIDTLWEAVYVAPSSTQTPALPSKEDIQDTGVGPEEQTNYTRASKIWFGDQMVDISAVSGKTFLEVVQKFQDAGIKVYEIENTNTNDVEGIESSIEQIAAAFSDLKEGKDFDIKAGPSRYSANITLSYSERYGEPHVDIKIRDGETLDFAFSEDKLSFRQLSELSNQELIEKGLFEEVSADEDRLIQADPENSSQTVDYFRPHGFITYSTIPLSGFGAVGEESLPVINQGQDTLNILKRLAVLNHKDTSYRFIEWLDHDNLDSVLSPIETIEGTNSQLFAVDWKVDSVKKKLNPPKSTDEIREQYEAFLNQEGNYGSFSFGFYLDEPKDYSIIYTVHTEDNRISSKSVTLFCADGASDDTVTADGINLTDQPFSVIQEKFLKGLNETEPDKYYLTDGVYEVEAKIRYEAIDYMRFKRSY